MKPQFDLTPVELKNEDIVKYNLIPGRSQHLFKLDSEVKSRLSAIIPTLATLPATKLYSVTIPAGQELIQVANKPHVFRGLFKSTAKGTRGISSHAELVGTSTAATLGSLMAASSFAVGQYYMHEINVKLERLDKKIDMLLEQQQINFMSRVDSLLTRIQDLQSTTKDWIENEMDRQTLIIKLNDEQKTVSELLENVIMTLEHRQIIPSNLEEYKRVTNDIDSLLKLQIVLLQIMSLISQMIALQNGRVNDNDGPDFSLFKMYVSKAKKSQEKLQKWHLSIVNEFSLDITGGIQHKENRITKIADRWSLSSKLLTRLLTKQIDDNLVETIVRQLNEDYVYSTDNLSDKPTKLLAQGGELYLEV